MTSEQFEIALREAKKAILTLYEMQRKALRERYLMIREEVSAGRGV